jgi:hypothetical protein
MQYKNLTTIDSSSLGDVIRTAWYSGRTIVPVVGAGLSVDAGVPAIASILRYLALVKLYVKNELYLPTAMRSSLSPLLQRLSHEYRDDVSLFIESNGWPDSFDIEYEVGLAIHSKHLSNKSIKNVQDAASVYRGELIKLLYESEANAVTSILNVIDSANSRSLENGSVFNSYDAQSLLLDWRKVLKSMTSYRREIAESLMASIYANRQPSQAHVFLAALSQLLGMKAIFTFNFDPLIERAMSQMAIRHHVFAMEHGNSLPAPMLIDRLSVVKMHGSTHNLLVDETLDHPLQQAYLDGFSKIVGDDALLIVLGCSGNDRRIKDIVKSVCERSTIDQHSVIWVEFSDGSYAPGPGVPYLNEKIALFRCRHLGMMLANLYCYLTSRYPKSAIPFPCLPAAFYRSVSGSAPPQSSLGGDQKQDRKITFLSSIRPDSVNAANVYRSIHHAQLAELSKTPLSVRQVYVDMEAVFTVPGLVAQIMDRIRSFDSSITPLTLLEQGTFGEEGETRCNDSLRDSALKAATRRIVQSLNRSRICLVLDGLDSFLYSPTMHHGSKASSGSRCVALFRFLDFLTSEFSTQSNGNGSRIIISTDAVERRRLGERETLHQYNLPNELMKIVDELERKSSDSHKLLSNQFSRQLNSTAPLVGSTLQTEEVQRKLALAGSSDAAISGFRTLAARLVLPPPADASAVYKPRLAGDISDPLSCLLRLVLLTARRTRPRILVDRVIDAISPEKTESSEKQILIDSLVNEDFLTALEGGFYGMDRILRNRGYREGTSLTGSIPVSISLSHKPGTETLFLDCLGQIIVSAFSHNLLADIYFRNLHMPSSDVEALVETLYHNLSSLRLLTDALLLIGSLLPDDELKHLKIDESESEDKPPPATIERCRTFLNKLVATPCMVDLPLLLFRNTALGKPTSSSQTDASIIELYRLFAASRKKIAMRIGSLWLQQEQALLSRLTPERLIAVCDAVIDNSARFLSGAHERKGYLQTRLNTSNSISECPLPSKSPAILQSLFRTKLVSLFNLCDYARIINSVDSFLFATLPSWDSESAKDRQAGEHMTSLKHYLSESREMPSDESGIRTESNDYIAGFDQSKLPPALKVHLPIVLILDPVFAQHGGQLRVFNHLRRLLRLRQSTDSINGLTIESSLAKATEVFKTEVGRFLDTIQPQDANHLEFFVSFIEAGSAELVEIASSQPIERLIALSNVLESLLKSVAEKLFESEPSETPIGDFLWAVYLRIACVLADTVVLIAECTEHQRSFGPQQPQMPSEATKVLLGHLAALEVVRISDPTVDPLLERFSGLGAIPSHSCHVLSLHSDDGIQAMISLSRTRILRARLYAKLIQEDKRIVSLSGFIAAGCNSFKRSATIARTSNETSDLNRMNIVTIEFREYFRGYQEAKNGVLSPNPSLVAQCEVFSAEAALFCCYSAITADGMSVREKRMLCRSKLASADKYLEASQGQLLRTCFKMASA